MKYDHSILCMLILLLFPMQGRAATDPGWNCDIHAYQYDMSVYLMLQQDNKPITGEWVVAAFCKDECRGIAELQSVKDASYYYLRVRSNRETGDSIFFKVYDRVAGKELATSGNLSFENLKQVGFPSQPWILALPLVIKPGEEGGLEQVTDTTEMLQLTGKWTAEEMNQLSAKIHKEEGGELINVRLSSVDLSEATLEEDVSLDGVFAGCSLLTSVVLPDISSLQKQSPDAFKNTNPNCVVFVSNEVNVPMQWSNDVNVVMNGVTELLILEENNPFHTPQAFKANQAIYRRTMGKTGSLGSAQRNGLLKSADLTGWETICLPFRVDIVTFGTDIELVPVSLSEDTYSGDFYIATLTDRGFELITDSKEPDPYLKANTPYLLNMTSSGGNSIEGMVTFKSDGEVFIDAFEPSYVLKRSSYDLVGIFEPVVASEGIYGLNEDGNTFVNKGRDVLPFEAYLRSKTTPLPSSVSVLMFSAVTGVQLAPEIVSVEEGKTVTLSVIVLPGDATNPKVLWSSSDEHLITVSSSGVVTGVKAGTAIITVQTEDGGFTATCSVTVTKGNIPPIPTVKVTGITVSPASYTLNVAETVQLSAVVKPADATNKKVTWSSSDLSVASVDATGLVVGHKTGNIIISAKTEEGGFSAGCSITINQATGIQEVDSKSIRVYPTLVSSSFVISGLPGDGQVELVSYWGQTVKRMKTATSSISLNASDLPTGHYIVKIIQKDQTYIFKIIKR